jgi:multidrug resistance efflux pump
VPGYPRRFDPRQRRHAGGAVSAAHIEGGSRRDSQQQQAMPRARDAPDGPPPRPRRRRGLYLLLLLLAVAAAGTAWWAVARPVEVVLARPWRGPAIEAVYATGLVEAIDTARVGTVVAARIVSLAAEEGDVVHAGQLLAQLDDSQARQRVSDAQARLALAEQELARDAELARRSITSVQQLQRSIQARDTAVAAVALAERQQADYRITAPLDGVIMQRPVQPGETLAANATLFQIASLAHLRVAADVDERDIPRRRLSRAGVCRHRHRDPRPGRDRHPHLPRGGGAAGGHQADDRHDGGREHRGRPA